MRRSLFGILVIAFVATAGTLTGGDSASELKKIQEKLQSGKMTEADKKALQEQLQEMASQLQELESLGVTQFNIYLMHDDMDGTLEAYGHDVIPAMHPLAAG